METRCRNTSCNYPSLNHIRRLVHGNASVRIKVQPLDRGHIVPTPGALTIAGAPSDAGTSTSTDVTTSTISAHAANVARVSTNRIKLQLLKDRCAQSVVVWHRCRHCKKNPFRPSALSVEGWHISLGTYLQLFFNSVAYTSMPLYMPTERLTEQQITTLTQTESLNGKQGIEGSLQSQLCDHKLFADMDLYFAFKNTLASFRFSSYSFIY